MELVDIELGRIPCSFCLNITTISVVPLRFLCSTLSSVVIRTSSLFNSIVSKLFKSIHIGNVVLSQKNLLLPSSCVEVTHRVFATYIVFEIEETTPFCDVIGKFDN